MLGAHKAIAGGYILLCIGAIVARRLSPSEPAADLHGGVAPANAPTGPLPEAARWFTANQRGCNAAEIEKRLELTPPPSGSVGLVFKAACYAIAGKSERAREIIDAIPPSDRASSILELERVIHPTADGGIDEITLPLCELVLDRVPDEPFALLQAGLAQHLAGNETAAGRHLSRFLSVHPTQDVARERALRALKEIDPR
jgi:thioredoxin-like negative regulator of GroEL